VNGVGDQDAEIVFVGEAPGQNEDEQGTPFVGSSGDLLTKAIHRSGLHRDEVRITNLVRCRPPENKDPYVSERENCLTHLRQELEDIDPSLIVPLGRIPSQTLLDNKDLTISEEAGRIYTVDDLPASVLLSVHPAATMYNSNLTETFYTAIMKAANYVNGSKLYRSEKIISNTNKRDIEYNKVLKNIDEKTTVLLTGPRYNVDTEQLRTLLREVEVDPEVILLSQPFTPFKEEVISLLSKYYSIYGFYTNGSWTQDPLYTEEITNGSVSRFDPNVEKRLYEVLSERVDHIVSFTDQITPVPELFTEQFLEKRDLSFQELSYHTQQTTVQ
jgi:DNA polymerase